MTQPVYLIGAARTDFMCARQVAEAFVQLIQEIGPRQVPGARHYLTFNMGGSMTTSVVIIWGKSAD